jgi:competence protein ComEC
MPALIAIALAFAAGILVSCRLDLGIWLGLMGVAVGAGFLLAGQNKRKAASVIVLVLAFFAGALRLSMVDLRPDQLAPYVDRTVLLEGTVISEAESTSTGTSYVLAVNYLGDDQLQPVTGRVLLRDLRPEAGAYYYGDLLRIRGRLVRPQAAANFGQFDYRAYLERRGVLYQLALAQEEAVELISENQGSSVLKSAFGVRRRLCHVATMLPSSDAALLKALTLGERQAVAGDVVNFFTASGTVHLMAVSGVHVGMVAALVLGLGRLFRLPFRLQSVFAGAVVLLYITWTGFAPSAVRAGIMFTLGLLGLSSGRPRNSLVALAAAALLLLLVNPLYLYDVGFQLSFAAAAGILYFNSQLGQLPFRWKHMSIPLVTSAAAQLCTWPLTAYHFSGVSLIGFLASVVVVPVAGLALVLSLLGLIIGSLYLPAGKLILGAAGAVLTVLSYLARLFASCPGAFIYVRRPSLLFMVVYYLVIIVAPALFQMQRGKIGLRRSLFLGVALALLIGTWSGPATSSLVVDFIAVGQGDAILIRLPSGQAVLIDAGPRVSTERGVWDAGEKILLPYFRSIGIHRLELIVLTHGDIDHIGGAPALINTIPVGAVIVPSAFAGVGAELVLQGLELRGIPVYTGSTGMKVDLGTDAEAVILSPPAEPLVSADAQNDNSLVLYLRHGQYGFLFTGDAGEVAEQYLLRQEIPDPVTVLKVAHHGAATASGEDFLQRITPTLAIISVGKNNFGHPSPETLERLIAAGATVLRTDEDGQVQIKSDGRKLIISTFAHGQGE